MLPIVGITFGFLYQVMAIIFFLCLTWLASMMLDSLVDRLPPNEVVLHSDFDQELQKWEHNFHLINEYIEKINSFFGLILLLALGKLALNINFSAFFTMQKHRGETHFIYSIYSLVEILVNGFHLTLILLVSHRIHQKVSIVKHYPPITARNSIILGWKLSHVVFRNVS